MQASNKVFFKASLSIALVAMMFIAPATFAKKDLFGSDPAGKPSKQSQQLISEPAPATQETSAEKLTESPPAPEAATPKSVSKKEKTSYIESQLVRLKLNIIETKNDLFGSGNKTKSTGVKQAEPVAVESLSATSASQPAEIATAISPSAASLRAQRLAEGQVMNVRKIQDEQKIFYAVKLLQKNGRMKTVNIDANTGDVIEEYIQ